MAFDIAPGPAVVLPTLDYLHINPEELELASVDAAEVALNWVNSFNKVIGQSDATAVIALFELNGWWRDILALTWNFRTFHGHDRIAKFVQDRVISGESGFRDVEVASGEGMTPKLLIPYPDLAWVQFFITFDTTTGSGTGVVRLVPSMSTGALKWKTFILLTAMTGVKGHPEKTGSLRNPLPSHGFWSANRKQELEFNDREPAVLIVGAGQSGLDVAARLKVLGVDTLIIDKHSSPGAQWKNRYEALCLHDPVWYDHMPYIPFPKSWPVFTPAPKLASWLSSYADAMELNVWSSSAVSSAHYHEDSKTWEVKVKREDGTERTVKPRHVVFALGTGSSVPQMPAVPGMDKFKGNIVHSVNFGTARDYIGKKALVVGACTSAHDVASDFHHHGVDVTMFQRSSTYVMSQEHGWPILFRGTYEENGPPTEVADLLTASMPFHLAKRITSRAVAKIAEKDKELIQDLEKAGFRTNQGMEGSGFLFLASEKAGGYYIDVGTSRLIADGKIKMVSETQLSHFTETSAVFTDGREVDCDVVVFATGFGDGRGPIANIIGPELGSKLIKIWGLDEEGETNSAWRASGVPGLYVMVGNLMKCRFHSLHIALQIKATEEGLWDGKRYLDRF
ncbi:hypothetical protein GYMLUDRAFT_78188 [Collybiopsis luxurians FD-317 M1]|uniref:FAD/NAD(P)-binding domain-containing protein n=1 Tax=Collybiopsis luxurians FD-317 M1 TaxID=944289 RepID=A0A0D0C170_9AGAR|nr:hypothetical protein GYMLUDRAFT_78188 [Collybiopsis luxurians FD-317 M1]